MHNSVSTEAEASRDTGAGRNQVPSWHMGMSQAMLAQWQGSNSVAAVRLLYGTVKERWEEGHEKSGNEHGSWEQDLSISICLNRNSFCAYYPAHQIS